MWLMNPGPVNTSEAVRRAALGADLCHREREFLDAMQRVRTKLLRVAGASEEQFAAALLAGSGTAAMELGVLGLVRPGQKLLVIENGVYGERIRRIAEVHGIAHVSVRSAWSAGPDLDAIERALLEDEWIDAVAMVHHETTTGMLNPVREVGALCRREGKLLFVDAISAFGAEPLDLASAGVDVMAGTANKCLHGVPGVAFVIASRRAEERLAEVPPRSLYFDLRTLLAEQRRGSVPFTPCVPATLCLDVALDELIAAGGVASRHRVYRARASLLRRELRELGLALYLDERLLSSSISTYRLPRGLAYATLHEALRRDGYVIYAGQGPLAREIFRVANMGEVPMEVYRALVGSIGKVVARCAA